MLLHYCLIGGKDFCTRQYLGVEDASRAVRRVRRQVLARTGHAVDPERIVARHEASLQQLRRTAKLFDLLRLFDDSTDTPHGEMLLMPQCEMERGGETWRAVPETRPPWCQRWLNAMPGPD